MGSGGSRPAVGKQRSLRSGKRIRTQWGGLAKKTTAATLQAKKKMTAAMKPTAATRMNMTTATTAANKTTSAATSPVAKNYTEAARPPTTKRMKSYKQKLVEGLSNKKVLSSITITQLTALYSTLYGPTVLQKLKS